VAIAGRSKENAGRGGQNDWQRRCWRWQADVAKLADVDKLYAEVSKKLGKIDVLFVNAGVAKFAPLAGYVRRRYTTSNLTSTSRARISQSRKRCRWPQRRGVDHLNTSVADRKGDGWCQCVFGNQSSSALFGENSSSGNWQARNPREHGCAGTNCYAYLWENRAFQKKRSMNSRRKSLRKFR